MNAVMHHSEDRLFLLHPSHPPTHLHNRVMTRGMVEDYISLRREMFIDVMRQRGFEVSLPPSVAGMVKGKEVVDIDSSGVV